jgi:hypothetical protein
LKCDGLKPQCGSCTAKRLECHYRDERNRKRDSFSQTQHQKVEDELKERIYKLEREIAVWKQKCYELQGSVGFVEDPFGSFNGNGVMGFREEGMERTGTGNDGQSGREWTVMHFPRANSFPQPVDYTNYRYADNHVSPILSEQRSTLTNSSGSNSRSNSVDYSQQQQRDEYSSPFGIRQLTTTNIKSEMPVNMGKRSHSASALPTQLNSPLPSHRQLIHSLPRPSASVPSFDIHYYQAIHTESKVPTSESAPEMELSEQSIDSHHHPENSLSQSFDSRILSSLMDTKPAYGTVYVQHYPNDQAYHNESYKYPGAFNREQDSEKSSRSKTQHHHQEHRTNNNHHPEHHRHEPRTNTHHPAHPHHQEHRTNNTHLPDQAYHGRYIQLTNPDNFPSYHHNLPPGNMNVTNIIERYQLSNI